MPTLTNLNIAYSRKVQLEQFEPVEHFVELEVEVAEDDDPDEVYDEYVDHAEDMVERAIAARVATKKMEADTEDDD